MKQLILAPLFVLLLPFFTACELDGEALRSDLEARLTPTPVPAREDTGVSTPPANPTPAPDPGGLPAGASQTFLWKPVSESDRNLVILLPASFRGRVEACTIAGTFGSESGRFHTDTHNGFRPHFRFDDPGAEYGSNVTVQALYDGNKVYTWTVPNGASRYEKQFTGF